MAHTIREKTKLISRVRRIRGQIEAVEAEESVRNSPDLSGARLDFAAGLSWLERTSNRSDGTVVRFLMLLESY